MQQPRGQMRDRAPGALSSGRGAPRLWLLLIAHAAGWIGSTGSSACTQAPDAGSFEVRFEWSDPPPAHPVWVFARVEQTSDGGSVAEAAPARYAQGIALDFERVPNGRDYVVAVEIKPDARRGSRSLYAGRSEPFDLQPGAHASVAVALALTRGPLAGDAAAAVSILEAEDNAFINNSRVTLALAVERATLVVAGNTLALEPGAERRSLAELPREAGRYLWRNWDLNAGLCEGDACLDSPRRVFVQFENAAGLRSEVYSATANLDTTAPGFAAPGSLAPPFANASAQVDLLVQPSEPLAEPPRLHVSPEDPGFSAAERVGQSYVFRYAVDDAAQEGVAYRFEVEMLDLAGNRSGPLPLALEAPALDDALLVDRSPPQASDTSVAPAVAHRGDEVELRFAVSEPLAQAPQVFVGTARVPDCSPQQPQRFVCRWSPPPDARDGSYDVHVQLVDVAGNASDPSIGVLAYDVQLPVVTDSVLRRIPDYAPAGDGQRLRASHIDPFTGEAVRVELSVFTDKPIAADPVLEVARADGATLPFALIGRDEYAARFAYTLRADDAAGSYGFAIGLDDGRGNAASQALPVELELAGAALGGTIDQARTRLTRIPWGAEQSAGTPRLSVRGMVSGGAARHVVVASAPVISADALIGRAPVEAGRFVVDRLTGGDRLEVYVATVDAAGQVGEFARVDEGEWVATLGGKVAGSSIANPHRFISRDVMPRTLVGDRSLPLEHGGAPLVRRDHDPAMPGSHVRTRGALRWTDLTPSAARGDHPVAAAYDAHHGGVAVTATREDVSTIELWRWSGTRWERETTAAQLGSALYFDASRGRLHSLDSERGLLFEYDGGDWRQRPTLGNTRFETWGWASVSYDSRRAELLLFGAGETLDEMWRLRGERWTQEPRAQPWPTGRRRPAMAYDSIRGRTYLFGGLGDSDHLDDFWVWDGARWSEIPRVEPWPGPRAGDGLAYDVSRDRLVLAAADATGRLALWEWDGERWHAGEPIAGLAGAAADLALTYDIARDRMVLRPLYDPWRPWEWDGQSWIQKLPYGAIPGVTPFETSLTFDAGRGALLLLSRYGYWGAPATWLWNGSRWLLQDAQPAPGARHAAAFSYDATRQRAVLFGGGALRDTWEWDGWGWSEATPSGAIPDSAAPFASTYDSARGRSVLLDRGGRLWEWDGAAWSDVTGGGELAPLGGSITYDAARGQLLLFAQHLRAWNGSRWSVLATAGEGRPARNAQAPFVFDARRGRAVLVSDGTWEWDGVAWRLASSEVPPAARAMAYDEANGAVTAVGDAMWRWDGARWHEVPNAASPLPGLLLDRAILYDEARDRLLALGSGTTWAWDERGFFDVTPLDDAPPARRDAAAVYDSLRQRSVLFGGVSYDGEYLADTWEWDGRSWRRAEVLSASPPHVRSAAATFDPMLGRMLLHGGTNGTGTSDELWSWDGARWEALAGEGPTPGAHCGHALTYDETRARAVLEVGAGDCRTLEPPTTWEWDGQRWTPAAETSPWLPDEGSVWPVRAVYHARRGRILAVGGETEFGSEAGAELGGAWEWDGERWTPVAPTGLRPLGLKGQMAYDRRRERVLLANGSDDTGAIAGLWAGDFHSRPGHLAQIDLAGMAPSELAIEPDELVITVNAGGDGTLAGEATAGAALYLWSGVYWRTVACNAAPGEAPGELSYVTRDPQVMRQMRVLGVLRFAVAPIGGHGDGSLAEVTTDYVEVRARYHLGQGPGVIATEPGAGGTGSGTCPAGE